MSNGAAPAAGAGEAGSEPSAPSLAARIDAVETALGEVDAALATLLAAAEAGASSSARVEFLQNRKLLLERQRSALNRIQQLEAELRPAEDGVAAEPRPESASEDAQAAVEAVAPTIQDFDVLLDEREAAERQVAVASGAVDAQDAAVERAEERLEEAGRARRALPEHADALTVEQAGWAESLAALRRDVASDQLTVAKLELKLAERQRDGLHEAVREMLPAVVFTREALDEQLAAIEAQRAALNEQLTEIYALLDRHQQQLDRAQSVFERAAEAEKTLAQERLNTAERTLRATRQGEQYLQQRLEHLGVEESAWRNRFAMFRLGRRDDYPRLLNEVNAERESMEADAAVVEPELRDVLSSALELQRRLDSPGLNGDGLRPILEARLEALERHAGYAREFLAALSRQDKVLTRLAAGLRDRIESEGWRAWYARARRAVWSAWDYELFAYEDEAYRVSNLTYSAATFLAVLTILLLVRKMIRRWWVTLVVRRTEGTSRGAVRDLGYTLINNTSTLVLIIVAFWAASWFLPLEWLKERRSGLITLAFYLQMAIYATSWMTRSINRAKIRMLREDPSSVTAYGLLSFFGRMFIWAVFVLLALMALGFKITPLIAGLGVGGIAVAFALQNILADVFNSVAIVLDKPFVVGDFIVVGDTMGVVESIGIKTTRIRALGGEQISVSNSDLLGSRIHNFKRMEERRVVFNIRVPYQTPLAQVEAIPGLLRTAVEMQEGIRFDRAHFQGYGDFALIYECVYYVLTSDFNRYMDIQQAINLWLYERFAAEGIEFAYPTQTLRVHGAQSGGEGDVESG